jgi:hypothetical protein
MQEHDLDGGALLIIVGRAEQRLVDAERQRQ